MADPAPDDSDDLRARVEALEARVESLTREVEQLRAAPPAATRRSAAKRPKRSPRPKRDRAAWVFKSEDWLNRIGIGLLLVGLAFLFKYSVDQGWIGAGVRLGFGAVLGAGLLGVGLRLYGTRRRYGQGLMGGGVAVWYATIFAAFQLYGLVSYGLAFGLMIAVTVLAFTLAVRQRDAVMAVIATQGGLGTPFLLFTPAGSVSGLVVYTLVILGCALALYLVHGWRTLLASAVIGGWLVFSAIAFDLAGSGLFVERTAFVAGVAASAVLFAGVPLARAVRHERDPERWPRSPLEWFRGVVIFEEPVRPLAVAVPLVSWLLTLDALDLARASRGWLLVGVAILFGGLAVWLRRRDLRGLGSAHAVSAMLVAVLAGLYLFDHAPLRLAALAGVATLAHLASVRWADRGLRVTAHAVTAGIVAGLVLRLLDGGGATPVLVRPDALLDLSVIALVATSGWTLRGRMRVAYLLAAWTAGLSWLWRDLVVLPNGQAWVSVAWGLSALALLAVGARSDREGARWTGLATLLFVVAKLFAIDLAELEAIWRILLFLGFGALLLVISYAFPSLWRRPEREAGTEERERDV